jgi:hypothetical protein
MATAVAAAHPPRPQQQQHVLGFEHGDGNGHLRFDCSCTGAAIDRCIACKHWFDPFIGRAGPTRTTEPSEWTVDKYTDEIKRASPGHKLSLCAWLIHHWPKLAYRVGDRLRQQSLYRRMKTRKLNKKIARKRNRRIKRARANVEHRFRHGMAIPLPNAGEANVIWDLPDTLLDEDIPGRPAVPAVVLPVGPHPHVHAASSDDDVVMVDDDNSDDDDDDDDDVGDDDGAASSE